MKHLSLTVICSAFINLLNAQEKQGVVNYGYIKSLFYGNKSEDEFNAVLRFDNFQSYFVTEKDSLENPNQEIQQYKVINISKSNGESEKKGLINIASGTNDAGNQVYYNRDKDSLWSYIKNMGGMYIAEKNAGLNWKLEKEKKKIGNSICNKATSKYKGRVYTAWYALEIPLPYGPWKLNGLPGLILEAYDSEYKIYFYFKNIEYPLKKEIKIDFIKEDIEEKFTQWFSYNTYLKHATFLIKDAYETMTLMFKEKGWSHKPIMPKIEQQQIEIAE